MKVRTRPPATPTASADPPELPAVLAYREERPRCPSASRLTDAEREQRRVVDRAIVREAVDALRSSVLAALAHRAPTLPQLLAAHFEGLMSPAFRQWS